MDYIKIESKKKNSQKVLYTIELNMRKKLALFNFQNIVKHGIFGYIIFFAIIALIRTFNSMLIEGVAIKFEISDFTTATIGFFLITIIKIIERFSTDTSVNNQ